MESAKSSISSSLQTLSSYPVCLEDLDTPSFICQVWTTCAQDLISSLSCLTYWIRHLPPLIWKSKFLASSLVSANAWRVHLTFWTRLLLTMRDAWIKVHMLTSSNHSLHLILNWEFKSWHSLIGYYSSAQVRRIYASFWQGLKILVLTMTWECLLEKSTQKFSISSETSRKMLK